MKVIEQQFISLQCNELMTQQTNQNFKPKYSKVSLALKHFFLQNLYYHCLGIRQAAEKCKLNYSTAKIILRDLNNQQKKWIKRIIRKKQKDEKHGMNVIKECSFVEVSSNGRQGLRKDENKIEIISRLGFNFFALQSKQ